MWVDKKNFILLYVPLLAEGKRAVTVSSLGCSVIESEKSK